MKKICFVTGTRADYGIMRPVMRRIAASPDAELQIVATNMHLSPDYGLTIKEIEGDGFTVNAKVESLMAGGDEKATVKSMAKVQEGLAEVFTELKPDMVVILGDRYEALAAASAAVAFNIPVTHLHGGETTLGAIDDKFRHAITQLSDMHFASTQEYADRIISMGKDPTTVFHSGAPGAEVKEDTPAEELNNTAADFYEKTGIRGYEPFILMAYHPVTLLDDKGKNELNEIIKALDKFINQGYRVLVTMPNSDPGTKEITEVLQEWGDRNKGMVILVKSLGAKLFRFAMETALAIVGNSSAALIEAPSFRLGAVNVGIRQKGRTHGLTVIDAPADAQRIEKALDTVMSMEMKAFLLGMPVTALNPYYKENAADFIARKILNCNVNNE